MAISLENLDKSKVYVGRISGLDEYIASSTIQTGQINGLEEFVDNIISSDVTPKINIEEKINNRIYDGRDLTVVFANEISNYANPWEWINARISNANYDGLYIGDYIPVTMSTGIVGGTNIASQTFQCQIAGIDTYYQCGDTAINHHIDFISREVINTEITWNPSNTNNGTADEVHPWLASQVYGWLNGVNNYSTNAYNSLAHGWNYTSGIINLLPTTLTNLIKTKRTLLDQRYSASALLTYSTAWDWQNMGKLWLPTETEAYGFQVRSNLGYGQGYWNPESNIGVAYPIYTNSGRNRIKRVSTGGRSSWWLSSAAANDGAGACRCNGDGLADAYITTDAGVRCPLCFRIGG